ncbi:MAG: type I DNA topoisomerase [Candidatus Pacebacteria bacterium]|nr:type I DNA topoisomerase [Candidatus Paceibacterota bacterium]
MKLVIVESPSKAKTIEKYLGSEYTVRSSVGHIRDLPKSNKDAINIESGFIPRYVISAGKNKVINELTSLAKKADEILLAPDPDREGEAIAWHLEEILKDELGKKIPTIKRVTFNEITKDAVTAAIEKPRTVDMNLKQAQEARRVLDRLVGYDLSGLIWKKVRYGLSAGRVQSPALRILMEREREIRAYDPEAYYVLEGIFSKGKTTFPLSCSKDIWDEQEAIDIVAQAQSGSWSVIDIKETKGTRKPKAPFTTSTMQQTASSRLGFSPSRTMRAAQKLYEQGHITYMRTDSQTLSKQAIAQIASHIEKTYGKENLNIVAYKTKSKNAQEAHEAVRPTNFDGKIKGSTQDEKSLYELILKRTVSSQMKPADIIRTKLIANISEADIPDFTTNGSRIINPGWLACDTGARGEDVELPKVQKGDGLDLKEITNTEKFTTPPNRYSEAGLIKELEKRGIGRPSTYASIIRTIVDRGYVEREGRTLFPTDTGDVVSSFLEEHFMNYIGDDFTAGMEDHLDAIASGEEAYISVLSEFYTPFKKEVLAKEDIPKLTNLGDAPKEFKCPKCTSSMVYKLGKTGKFMSCSTYPDCDGALTQDGKEIGNEEPMGTHPETGENIYLMEGRFGPYVQLGETPVIPKATKFPKGHKKTDEEKELVKKEKALIAEAKALPKPKRASLPAHIKPEDITLEQAVHLLILPRDLGIHPDSGEMTIANIGRFGPYVGHGREFRSIKKTSGLDPYTITFEQAIELLNQPKALPKGVELFKDLGKHPKTGKDIRLLKSKSGYYIQKGLSRLYLDDKQKPEKFTLEDAISMLSGK